MPNLFVVLPVPSGTGVGAAVDVSGFGGDKTIVIAGSFTGALYVQASCDGVNFVDIDSFIGPDNDVVNVACEFLRVRTDGLTGAPVCAVGAFGLGGLCDLVDVPAGNGTGVALDISAYGPEKALIVAGPYTGYLEIEISTDGVNFVALASFLNPGIQQIDFTAQKIRVLRSGVAGGVAPLVFVGAQFASLNAPSTPPVLTIENISGAPLTLTELPGSPTLAIGETRTFGELNMISGSVANSLVERVRNAEIKIPSGYTDFGGRLIFPVKNGDEPADSPPGAVVFSVDDAALRTQSGAVPGVSGTWVSQGRDWWTQIEDLASQHGSGELVVLPRGQALMIAGGTMPTPLDPEADISDVCEKFEGNDNSWEGTNPIPTPVTASFGVTLRSGNVLVAGGVDSFGPLPLQFGMIDDASLRDPTTGVWTPTGNMPAPWAGGPTGENLPAVRLKNGEVLVAGGFRNDEQAAPSPMGVNGTITFVAGTTYRFNSPGAGFAPGDVGKQLVLYSGTDPNDGEHFITAFVDANTVDYQPAQFFAIPGPYVGPWLVQLIVATAQCARYSEITGLWAPAASMNSPRENHTLTLLADGKVLAVGGSNVIDFPGSVFLGRLNTAEVYDPDLDTWTLIATTMPPIPEVDPFVGPYSSYNGARSKHAAELLPDGRVIIFGGFVDLSATIGDFLPTRTGLICDLSLLPGDPWVVHAGLQLYFARGFANAAGLVGGNVLAFGGNGFPFGQELVECEYFDFQQEVWVSAAPMPARAIVDGIGVGLIPCSGNTPHALLPDGRLLVAAGDTFSTGGGSLGIPWESNHAVIYAPGVPATAIEAGYDYTGPPIPAATAKLNVRKTLAGKSRL